MGSEIVLLPCEFCNKMIVLENLLVHQTGCRPDLACFQNLQLQENVCLSNKSNELKNHTISVPCEFCGISIILNDLLPLQIICRKNNPEIYNKINNSCIDKHNTKDISQSYGTDSLQSSNILTSQTQFYQNKSNEKPPSTLKVDYLTKNWIDLLNIDLYKSQSRNNVLMSSEFDLPSTSKNNSIPTLVLKKLKLTNEQFKENASSLNEKFVLPLITNSGSVSNNDDKKSIGLKTHNNTLSLFEKVIQKSMRYARDHVS